jgi:hypothetical protein
LHRVDEFAVAAAQIKHSGRWSDPLSEEWAQPLPDPQAMGSATSEAAAVDL